MNKKNERLAYDIYNWCKEHELWGYNIIYFNGKALSSSAKWGNETGKEIYPDLFEYENKNPRHYFEYGNPETLSMSFEGELYYVLNAYVRGWIKREEELTNLFKKYGYYYEMGHAWNLSAFKL